MAICCSHDDINVKTFLECRNVEMENRKMLLGFESVEISFQAKIKWYNGLTILQNPPIWFMNTYSWINIELSAYTYIINEIKCSR